MFGTVRGVFTIAGAGTAGLLIWVSTQIGRGTVGGYWAVAGILAGAGLTMALSQLFGGWTKWGWPRVSTGVFVIAFLPVLVVAVWILAAGQPEANWGQRHIVSWSRSIGIDGVVDDLRTYLGVLAFGLGLLFGLTFDTAGPREARGALEPAAEPLTLPAPEEIATAEVPAEPESIPEDAPPLDEALHAPGDRHGLS